MLHGGRGERECGSEHVTWQCSDRGGPLNGVRVLELAAIGPVPFAARLLADLGADVVRVERPRRGAVAEALNVEAMSRGQRSVGIDLKSTAGADVALALAAEADVLLEGFRPGVAERMGLGPADCRDRNPRLVYGRMTGWGQDGPLAHTAGHDINYLALSGALHAFGPADGTPVPPLNLVADYGGGGMLLAVGVLAALVERSRSGHGQVVDAAMVDGAALLMSLMYVLRGMGQWSLERGGNMLDGSAPFYRTYATSDGGFVAVGAVEPQFFRALVEGLGRPELSARQYDPAGWPELTQILSDTFGSQTRDHWAEVFEGTDACVTPVLNVDEAPLHAHNQARSAFVIDGNDRQPAPAPRFDRSGTGASDGAPTPGEHTVELLRGLLPDDQVSRLIASGVLWQPTAQEVSA